MSLDAYQPNLPRAERTPRGRTRTESQQRTQERPPSPYEADRSPRWAGFLCLVIPRHAAITTPTSAFKPQRLSVILTTRRRWAQAAGTIRDRAGPDQTPGREPVGAGDDQLAAS